MLIQSPPATQNTPAIEMPYSADAPELTGIGGEAGGHLGYLMTGDGPAVRWEVHGDLTGAPVAKNASADASSNGTNTGDERDLRLRLLATKYGRSGFSREDQARLEILNERLRRVMLRVSEEDVAVLEETAQQLEDSRDLRRQLEEKYGL